tara:strand:- start:880 stop:1410 length:531 start_codon:yes stop_codon:yes gene_type:complete
MPKFKAYVKVPADSKGSLKRIITKTVNADNSVDALATLRGKYGASNVNITQQVGNASKSKVNKSSSQTTYIPKSSTFVKKKYSYKYAKPAPRPMTNKETIEDLSALSVGVIKTISFFLKIFNSITYETLFTIFGKPKVYYWAKNKKHLLAFSTSLINMTMLFLLLKGISIWLIGMG